MEATCEPCGNPQLENLESTLVLPGMVMSIECSGEDPSSHVTLSVQQDDDLEMPTRETIICDVTLFGSKWSYGLFALSSVFRLHFLSLWK